MKNILKLALALILVVSAVSCRDEKSNKPVSQGSPYELMFVADRAMLDGALGDTIRKIMDEPVGVINSAESIYSLYSIPPSSFDGLVARHRNVLMAITGSEYKTPTMVAQYDVYSAPQIIVKMIAPDSKTLVDYVSEHRHELQSIFEIAERNRSINQYKTYGDRTLSTEVNKQFDFDMMFPKGYRLRNSIPEKNFMWISNEHPLASQGVIIYTYPYSGENDFTIDALTKRRDEFVGLIPGENPNSHMITVSEFKPEMRIMRINGRPWIELRGFWDVKHDFMGGPFVSYATLDAMNSRIITIDLYVYSPDKPKRNYLRQLEHLIYGVTFPGDENGEEKNS